MKTLIKNGIVLYEGEMLKLDILFDESGILKVAEKIEEQVSKLLEEQK